ncbi:type III pantothenate kinase [Ponticaulis sp.]|jgi:type III pantothenate kinase|uniref:type III pantothenate kinase n=1 Tax=Ponticaulis sp. TaxID=2020902 RepID=UPI000C46B003|nr:type III pantothenate kinase [Ponticaulis sp.]MAF56382.1 pantothenate kinase [Ponticaulis sp.]MAJ08303.1 pantothenate kinase [Ponticaulis sp.]MBN04677.1 pantothenate kinase [Ponticaulis sp.]HBJ94478.1 type III pantothenate kinase [Hyphomonadaceae bacterium]|tara:strand:- start:39127 stop:39897 length:771 start_codon:yes stop_codon:yes gene_type:complete
MLLAIDVGNTNTVFGLHDGESWVAQWRSATDSTKTADDYAVWLTQLCRMDGIPFGDLDACIISSVVPQARFNFRNLARRYLDIEPMFIGESSVELGVPIRISRPEQVGADRLVNAVGAHAQHEGALIVVDSGTATTFDIVGADGGFEGGIISPGINLSMRALHDAAASLPRIAIQRPPQVIGQDTVSAMQSGIFLGYLDLIDGLIRRIKAEYTEPMTVIGTGGVASLFEGESEEIDIYDPDVTIRGLLEIYRRNKK